MWKCGNVLCHRLGRFYLVFIASCLWWHCWPVEQMMMWWSLACWLFLSFIHCWCTVTYEEVLHQQIRKIIIIIQTHQWTMKGGNRPVVFVLWVCLSGRAFFLSCHYHVKILQHMDIVSYNIFCYKSWNYGDQLSTWLKNTFCTASSAFFINIKPKSRVHLESHL